MLANLSAQNHEEGSNTTWLLIIANFTVLAILINIFSMFAGNNDVAPHLLYIPVTIASYWYPKKGVIFSFGISALYILLVWILMGGDSVQIVSATFRCVVVVGAAAVISSLSFNMQKNELKYRSIFNNSEVGICIVRNDNYSIIEANQRFIEMTGQNTTHVKQMRLDQLFIKPEEFTQFLQLIQENVTLENFETCFHSKTQNHQYVLISTGALPENQSVIIVMDITDRKKMEQDLLIKDHSIRSSINAISIFTFEYTTSFVNKAFLTILNFTEANEVIGKSALDFLIPRERIRPIQDALETDGNWFGETVLYKSDATPIYVQLSVNFVKNEKGRPICIMWSFIDITEQKQMEIAKRTAFEQIEKNIEQFAILGDHIRNPLTVIVGLSSLFSDDIARKILTQTKEIDRIITQLDKGWIESEKVREFVKRYYKIGSKDTDLEKKIPYKEN